MGSTRFQSRCGWTFRSVRRFSMTVLQRLNHIQKRLRRPRHKHRHYHQRAAQEVLMLLASLRRRLRSLRQRFHSRVAPGQPVRLAAMVPARPVACRQCSRDRPRRMPQEYPTRRTLGLASRASCLQSRSKRWHRGGDHPKHRNGRKLQGSSSSWGREMTTCCGICRR